MLVNSNMYKNSVQTQEIDNLGHMNVQYYVKHFIDSCTYNFKINNLTSKFRNLKEDLFLENITIRYLNEQRLGTPFLIDFYISKIENEKIEVFQEMKNLETKKISATAVSIYKFNQQRKKIKKEVENFLLEYPNKYKTAPFYAKKKGLLNIKDLKLDYIKLHNYPNIFDSFCGLAYKKNGSSDFFLDASDYMGIVSAAVPNLLQMSNHSIYETNIGGAAVEYEFRFYDFVKQDSCIKLLSGLRSIKNKTYTWSHWLIDIDNEKILAIANSVIVAIDLKNRKSVQVPIKLKNALEKIIMD